jgi:hypothetical protein
MSAILACLGCLVVLMISVLDALRPSFEDNSVSELVVFCHVLARSTWSFPEPSSACSLGCFLACHSIEFVGSCKIYNLMSFSDICNKKSLSFSIAIISLLFEYF